MVRLFFSPEHCGSWGMFTMCQWEYGSFSDKLDKYLPYSENPGGRGVYGRKSDPGAKVIPKPN